MNGYGAITLNPTEFAEVKRLHATLDIPLTSVSEIALGTLMCNDSGTAVFYLTVEFKSGHGNRTFHVTKDGVSAPSEGMRSALVK